MAIIKCDDGSEILWSGEVQGPIPHHNQFGQHDGVYSFYADLGVGASGTRKITVVVTSPVMDSLGFYGHRIPKYECARKCVARFIENHCKTGSILENGQLYINREAEMRALKDAVLADAESKRAA
jgi:hypothetical protein